MKNNKKPRTLLKSKKSTPLTDKLVSLEELESLCYTFDRRGRGCTLVSTGSDDVLF
jgi:hypothetical protein